MLGQKQMPDLGRFLKCHIIIKKSDQLARADVPTWIIVAITGDG